MFGRLSYLQGDPEQIDDLITYVREVVKPATDQLDGNLGLGMWVNRENGDSLVMTVWRDDATLRASEQAVLRLRDDAADIAGGTATVERCEVMVREMTIPHEVGFGMRLVRIQANPATLEEDLGWVRNGLLPTVTKLDGFVSYVLGIDRESGIGCGMTTFRSMADAKAAATAAAKVRDEAASRGTAIRGVHEYEVAIVGIRVPIPAQRVDLTESEQTARR